MLVVLEQFEKCHFLEFHTAEALVEALLLVVAGSVQREWVFVFFGISWGITIVCSIYSRSVMALVGFRLMVRNLARSRSNADNLSRWCKWKASFSSCKSPDNNVIAFAFGLSLSASQTRLNSSRSGFSGSPREASVFGFYFRNGLSLLFFVWLYSPICGAAPHAISSSINSLANRPSRIFFTSPQMRSPLIFCRPSMFSATASSVCRSWRSGSSAVRP